MSFIWVKLLLKSLKEKGKVKISNFGTFILRHKKSRVGRNPKTKKEAVISERNVILFKPSIGIEVKAKIPPMEPSICNHIFFSLHLKS